jgi:hypothetical protein
VRSIRAQARRPRAFRDTCGCVAAEVVATSCGVVNAGTTNELGWGTFTVVKLNNLAAGSKINAGDNVALNEDFDPNHTGNRDKIHAFNHYRDSSSYPSHRARRTGPSGTNGASSSDATPRRR